MKVLVSGSTGFVGSALVAYLKRKGHTVVRLVRHRINADEPQVGWDIEKGLLNPADLDGVEAIIHLAGENIFGRWTKEKKQRILDSRVKSTRLLVETIKKMDRPPHTFITASAVGYYGNRGDEVLSEVSGSGEGFLAEVCRQWEAEAQKAASPNVRVTNARFGMILDPEGSALKVMLPAFRLGVAGNLGGGKQYMSWVTREDLIVALDFILNTPRLRGAVNVCAPHPVTNREFTRTLKNVATFPLSPGRIWSPHAPGLIIKLATGQMGEELLLHGQRAEPVRLLEAGFRFKYPDLQPALKALLG